MSVRLSCESSTSPDLCYRGLANGMMFSIETLAGCVTLDLTTKYLVVRSKVALFVDLATTPLRGSG